MAHSKEFMEEVLTEFRKCMANVTLTCRHMHISRDTFYEWLDKVPEFAAEVQYIKDHERQDFVEHALFDRIQKGDTTAIIFACKTLCKNRGYVERHEVVGKDGSSLIPSRMTDEEIQAEIARLKDVGD